MDDYGANVVLTADNSQYDQAMTQSAQNTDTLGKSVDSLGHKLESLSKRAGKTFLGISAADTATIVAATGAYAAFEKQMTSLNTQAAILSKTTSEQKRTMSDYASQVNTIRRSFGETTENAAQLVQTISKMRDMTKAPEELAKTFAKMGEATQESSTRLATSMLQLQRTMGTPQRDTEKFANQLTVLSARSNASASSILDFANSIAPVGRLVNMTQTDIQGFSNAFIKAGQDGYQASNVFNKMLSDISYATQSGSPELAKYANLVGMTTQSFKELGGSNQILSIFDAINRQGPAAITTLNRMGYDGARTVRTITAMSQQSGGLGTELQAARNADPNAMDRGSEQAMSGIVDSLKRLRAEINQTAETFGKNFAPAAEGFISGLTKMASVARIITDSPIGKLAAVFAAVAAPLAAIAGTSLLAAKGLATFAAARAALTGALASGFRETRALGPVQNAAMAEMGVIPGVGRNRAAAGERGAEILRRGSWTNRMFYNTGADVGRLVGAAREGPGLLSRGVGYGATGVGWFNRNVLTPQFQSGSVRIPGVEGTGGYSNITDRMRFFSARTMMGSLGATPEGFWGRQAAGFRLGMAGVNPTNVGAASHDVNRMYTEAYAMNKRMNQTAGGSMGSAVRMADAEKYAGNVLKSSKGLEELSRTSMTATKGIGNMAGSFARLSMVIASTGLGAARQGLGMAGRVGSSAMAGLGISPWLLGIGAGIGGYALIKGALSTGNPQYKDTSGFGNPYLQAGGAAPPQSATLVGGAKSAATTIGRASTITPTDVLAGRDSSHKLTNSQLKGLSVSQAVARLAPTMQFIRSNPQALQSLKLDLIDKFGAGQADTALKQLMASEGGVDSNAFVAPALDPGKEHWFSRNASAEKSMSHLNQLGGAYTDQLNAAFASGGTNLASQLRGNQMSELLGDYARGTKGKNLVQTKGQRIALNKFLFKQFFGIDISDKEADKLEPPQGEMTNQDALSSYMQSIGSRKGQGPYGGYGLPGSEITSSQMDMIASTLGLDPNLINRDNFGTKAAGAILSPTQTSDANTLENRLGRMRSGSVFGLASVTDAMKNEGDPSKQYDAGMAMYAQMKQSGLSAGQIQRRLGNFLGATGDDDQRAGLIQLAQQFNNRSYNAAMPTMSRTDQFAAQTSMFRNTMATNIGNSPTNASARQGAIDTFTQQAESQREYFQQMLYQQREFDISRARAEQDFNLQRQYAQADFARQRARAEEDYQIQRKRAEADFGRSMSRGRTDYNLQRQREDADHQHQVMLMIDQQAKAMYDMYSRVKVQRTDSATWLLGNSADQTRRMKEQEAQLKQLRGMGLQDDTIQQMGLTDPANAQQLSRFVSEVAADPSLVKKFNKEVGDRLKAAAALVKDDSSQEWEEFQRSYTLSRTRAQADFEKSVKRARQDFKRNMNEQDDDFQRSLKRQNQDFGISMNRSEDAFRLSMNRSAEDLSRSAQTIDGNFENILEKAATRLSGHAGKMAKNVLAEFRSLRSSTAAQSDDIMQVIADIFGVDYKTPKSALKAPKVLGNAQSGYHVAGSTQIFKAAGGVLPGWSPGVDNHKFVSPTGGELNLSGGEAVMVPEWTKRVGGPGAVAEMNRQAKKGFASGGVYDNPDRRVYVDGEPLSAISAAQLMLAERLGHKSMHVMQGSWQPKTSYSGTSHMGPGVMDVSPGNFDTQYWMRRVAFAAWGRNFPGAATAGSGAHVHAVSRIDPGARGQSQLASFAHGGDGLGGSDYGPNPSVIPGLATMLKEFGPIALSSGSGGGGAPAIRSFASISKALYPKVEEAVAKMHTLRPLDAGQASTIINYAAKSRYDKLYKKALANFGAGIDAGMGMNTGSDIGAQGTNQRIVRQYANQFGWGNQWDTIVKLVNSESHFDNHAQNPHTSAHGMFQFLDSTWDDVGGHKTDDPNLQALYGMRYIKQRYGDPAGAWKFHQSHGWFGDGAIFQGPQTIGVGERGPEAVIPLNDKGTDFMVGLMNKMSAGMEAKQGNVRYSTPAATTHNQYHYRIDRSTTFSGPITVAAQNPNEFLAQLQAKQRVAALSQPSLGGIR